MAPTVSAVPAMTAWASMVGSAPCSTRSTSVQREAMWIPRFIRYIVTTPHSLTAFCFGLISSPHSELRAPSDEGGAVGEADWGETTAQPQKRHRPQADFKVPPVGLEPYGEKPLRPTPVSIMRLSKPHLPTFCPHSHAPASHPCAPTARPDHHRKGRRTHPTSWPRSCAPTAVARPSRSHPL